LCGKAIKPSFFKAPLQPSDSIRSPLFSYCGYSPRRGVFYRKGRGGFAEDAGASRPLRKVIGGCGSRPAAGSLRKGREALAPFAKPLRPINRLALQKHRNAVKKHANFFRTIPGRTKLKISVRVLHEKIIRHIFVP
jgi:hypothetical protein